MPATTSALAPASSGLTVEGYIAAMDARLSTNPSGSGSACGSAGSRTVNVTPPFPANGAATKTSQYYPDAYGFSCGPPPQQQPPGQGLGLGSRKRKGDEGGNIDVPILGQEGESATGDDDDGTGGGEIGASEGGGAGKGQKEKKATSEKRKAQNRAAQRNFRERKEKQAKENEEHLALRIQEVIDLRAYIDNMHAQNTFLRSQVSASVLAQLGNFPPVPPVIKSTACPVRPGASSPTAAPAPTDHDTEAANALSSLAGRAFPTSYVPALGSATSRNDTRATTYGAQGLSATLAQTPRGEPESQIFPDWQTTGAAGGTAALSGGEGIDWAAARDVALPSGHRDFWNHRFHAAGSVDDPNEAGYVGGALWRRPPSLSKGENARNMLRGTQAWGMLLTHPLIKDLDLDELARALQMKAKCAADGTPVLSREDCIDLWDSVPRRVEGRKKGYHLGEDGHGQVSLGD